MRHQLAKYGHTLTVVKGDILEVFDKLHKHYLINTLWSHQEIGLANTFARDLAVAKWCEANQIRWHESLCGAVIRGATTRKTWDRHWTRVMKSPQCNFHGEHANIIQCELPSFLAPTQWQEHDPLFQPGGEQQAQYVLEDFLAERGKKYHTFMSKPVESASHCSRLSPYLAWGNISIRTVYQRILQQWCAPGWRKALSAFSSRLHWHCHFIQKFESECAIESRPINRAYVDYPFREDDGVEKDLHAWKTGNTGIPLIDAAMRCLIHTGFINFRMRAMLVSFLCHHLQIDWRLGVSHLASVFLDFEPGIHYPQFHMQAGVTGINRLRIYNPVKQSQEHDPNGVFIRRWCPELSELDNSIIHTPWALLPMEKAMLNIHYPDPIIDIKKAAQYARELMWDFRERRDVQREAKRILGIHVRERKSTHA